MATLSNSAQRVQNALKDLGLALQVVELPASTRTAAEAARAVGCQVAQIAKSLVFETVESHCPLLVIASGANRVDVEKLARQVGEPVRKASAEFARHHTGFAIGGIPPVGHVKEIETFIDRDLLALDEIWAAAGTPRAVFRLTGADLLKATGGKVITVTT